MTSRTTLASLALTGVAALSLAACGSGATSSATAAASSAEAVASSAAGAASSAAGTASEAVESAKPSGSATGSSGTYTMQDVEQHATAADCWAVVNKNVYNLTAWESEHPGGAQRIIDLCGTDATDAFTRQHSGQSEPQQELAEFKIGTLS